MQGAGGKKISSEEKSVPYIFWNILELQIKNKMGKNFFLQHQPVKTLRHTKIT